MSSAEKDNFDPWTIFTGKSVDIEYVQPFEALAINGKFVDDIDVWRLASAMDGCHVRVSLSEQMVVMPDGSIEEISCVLLECEGAVSEGEEPYLQRPIERRIFQQDDGTHVLDVIGNDSFILEEAWQGRGIGRCALALQVEAAYRLGFSHLIADAVGASGGEYSGYAVWPKLGYDGQVPEDVLKRFEPGVLADLGLTQMPLKVSDFMTTPERVAAWEKFGCGFPMRFMLSSGSKALEAMLEIAKSKPNESA
ncbi:hypothetical protein [Tahibacter caeni]|uniref:hypothetical protein n=1 Tax=Tahibacter caeni TaxID=1453545 RepID=UPI002147FF0B|nr:hypothetical protein [Tahibacter caeni]